MRGCDCRKIWVRSDTVSSASASSTRMRRRVSSPAALRAPLRASNGRWADPLMGNIPSHKDIFIPLSYANQWPGKREESQEAWAREHVDLVVNSRFGDAA